MYNIRKFNRNKWLLADIGSLLHNINISIVEHIEYIHAKSVYTELYRYSINLAGHTINKFNLKQLFNKKKRMPIISILGRVCSGKSTIIGNILDSYPYPNLPRLRLYFGPHRPFNINKIWDKYCHDNYNNISYLLHKFVEYLEFNFLNGKDSNGLIVFDDIPNNILGITRGSFDARIRQLNGFYNVMIITSSFYNDLSSRVIDYVIITHGYHDINQLCHKYKIYKHQDTLIKLIKALKFYQYVYLVINCKALYTHSDNIEDFVSYGIMKPYDKSYLET